jgi:transposase InsO family protein
LKSITNIFDLPEEKLKDAQAKYGLLEPLVSGYLSAKERANLFNEAAMTAGVSYRTLRRWVKKLREMGMRSLARKIRKDFSSSRSIPQDILQRIKNLLTENPDRSLSMALNVLRDDPDCPVDIIKIPLSTFYHRLKAVGFSISARGKDVGERTYRRFEALCPNHLWQGDARMGIPLPNPGKPGKTRMTHLFAWVDDFSRKVMHARYYWDEKLPRMEDCFRHAVISWGIPQRLYCDNGSVYVAHQFTMLLDSLGVRKIHHPPYQAWCKGKIEAFMKTLLKFQTEARQAGIKTLEELNQSLFAWIEVEYNNKVHSSTAETPNDRFRNAIDKKPLRRITDLDQFHSLFFFREERVVDKSGYIRFNANLYKTSLMPGEILVIRFDPFDISQIALFQNDKPLGVFAAVRLNQTKYANMPESHPHSGQEVSESARRYFERIRQKHLENIRKNADAISFSNIIKPKEPTDESDH